MASHATPEFIRAECARFSLLTQSPSTWPPQVLRQVRDRMDQYNHAWSTLQYSDTKFFTIPQTSDVTPWAGSNEWRSGNHFMGESNGYVYDACSWEAPGPAGTQMLARVCLTQVPSLRTGEVDLKRIQFNVVLSSHYVKAVTVDPVAQVVGILEYNNGYSENVYSRIPVLHVYHLKGHRLGSVQIRVGFQTGAEVYHMEMHGEMVCIVANHSTNKGTLSAIMIQNWTARQSPCLGKVVYWFSVHYGRPIYHDRKVKDSSCRRSPQLSHQDRARPEEHAADQISYGHKQRGLDTDQHHLVTQHIKLLSRQRTILHES
ncbi:hypothetical protein B0H11DRAFT_474041 [Mycena galericulata]|nr:hypothetical protein B0H11DRAFT_474041 [Mycena galericulata]